MQTFLKLLQIYDYDFFIKFQAELRFFVCNTMRIFEIKNQNINRKIERQSLPKYIFKKIVYTFAFFKKTVFIGSFKLTINAHKWSNKIGCIAQNTKAQMFFGLISKKITPFTFAYKSIIIK